MPLHQVPASWPHDERRDLVVQLVFAAVGVLERDLPLDRIDEVALTLDHVRPRRRVRILEVCHVHRGARVQRVDDHLPIGPSSYLGLADAKVLRDIGDAPILLSSVGGPAKEVERPAAAQPLGDLGAPREPLDARGFDLAMQSSEKVERLGRQHVGEALGSRCADLGLDRPHRTYPATLKWTARSACTASVRWSPAGAAASAEPSPSPLSAQAPTSLSHRGMRRTPSRSRAKSARRTVALSLSVWTFAAPLRSARASTR